MYLSTTIGRVKNSRDRLCRPTPPHVVIITGIIGRTVCSFPLSSIPVVRCFRSSGTDTAGYRMSHHADYSNFDSSASRKEALEMLLMSYEALAESQTNWVANLANCSSLLYHCYKDSGVNWAGFYVVDKEHDSSRLILGPFMGKVACQTIQIGTGVCGTAAAKLETQLVPNVEEFPGHIACDGMTKSEIVCPITQDGKLVGVLDIDCLNLNGFGDVDKHYLEILCSKISETCKF